MDTHQDTSERIARLRHHYRDHEVPRETALDVVITFSERLGCRILRDYHEGT
ncbi:MAG: hypothetical protein JW765_09015 [Deltaproteobacteria bacterium]|nr:hypothetical protein [Candidatus Zymogenaceae bacterium]